MVVVTFTIQPFWRKLIDVATLAGRVWSESPTYRWRSSRGKGALAMRRPPPGSSVWSLAEPSEIKHWLLRLGTLHRACVARIRDCQKARQAHLPNSPFCKCRECPQREVQLWIPHSAPNGALISLDWLLAWIGCLAACLRSLSQDPVSGPCLRTLSGTLSQDPCRHESAVVQ
jgi:hypothetical protein